MTTEYTDDEFRARLLKAYVAGHVNSSKLPHNRSSFDKWFAEEFPEHTNDLSELKQPEMSYQMIPEHEDACRIAYLHEIPVGGKGCTCSLAWKHYCASR